MGVGRSARQEGAPSAEAVQLRWRSSRCRGRPPREGIPAAKQHGPPTHPALAHRGWAGAPRRGAPASPRTPTQSRPSPPLHTGGGQAGGGGCSWRVERQGRALQVWRLIWNEPCRPPVRSGTQRQAPAASSASPGQASEMGRLGHSPLLAAACRGVEEFAAELVRTTGTWRGRFQGGPTRASRRAARWSCFFWGLGAAGNAPARLGWSPRRPGPSRGLRGREAGGQGELGKGRCREGLF